MIPLFHDFTGESVLVFGGGRVGARKARRFAREANVFVVSPTFADAEFGDVERIQAAPDPADVAGWVERVDPALVVAATDDEDMNGAAAEAAREHGAMVNRADRSASDADESGRPVDDVVVPATVRDEPVTVAVSTGGSSPALAKYLRQAIEAEIAGAGAMAELTGTLREELAAEGMPPAERHRAIREVVQSSRVWKALRTGDSNGRQEAERVIWNQRGDKE